MRERIDHATEALKQLSDVEAYSNDAHSLRYAGKSEDRIRAALDHGTLAALHAQTLATLALMEQQRVANLIALSTEVGYVAEVVDHIDGRLQPDIAQALGVEQ